MNSSKRRRPARSDAADVASSVTLLSPALEDYSSSSSRAMASRNASCADCDPSTTASTASVSSDLHKYHVACSCGGSQYAECTGGGGGSVGDRVKSERPPALPPRPPPRNATGSPSTRNNSDTVQSQRTQPNASTANSGAPGTTNNNNLNNAGPRKYVWWCTGMGAASCLLGALLLAAALLLRTRTASLHHLETIPTPVPATMLVLTGICVMSLARRRNRYSYLIKVAGGCCLVCAFTCVLVTITTTVIHMNRLQTLRECVYTRQTKTCTCFSVLLDSQNTSEDEGVKCVFEAVADCAAVHGDLYRCLRAVFGLSVAGVLVCICSAMLAYQLLSHERKKMYWEQLELRCRSLYRPTGAGQTTARPHPQQPQACGECCSQCRVAAAVSWDLQHRFWASGRVGNLYSPNPGTGRRVSPWSWFPWPRNSNQRVGGSSSGDSAYGFGANSPGGYWQLGPPPPYTPHHRHLHQRNGAGGPNEPGRSPPHRHTLLQSHLSQQLSPHLEGCVSTLPDAHHRRVIQHHALHCDAVRCEHATRTSSSSPSNSNVMMMMNGSPSQMMTIMMEGNSGHSGNMNSAALGGGVLTGVDGRRDSEASTVHRVECHHQNNLESNRDSFAEELENIHQHTCQKHGQRSDAEIEAAILQGEENLGFQCEKQAQQRQARGGESELYFADVSSCCNVSLKAVDYCAGGLVGTIENQPDTWSGCDSDNNQNTKPSKNTSRKNHKFHHSSNTGDIKQKSSMPSCSNDKTDETNLPPRNHRRLISSSPNSTPNRLQNHCDEALNQSHRNQDVAGMLNSGQNRHRSPELQCNGSRESSMVMCHDDSSLNDSMPCVMSQGFMCRSNHARSSLHYRDDCRQDSCRFVNRCQHHCINEAEESANGCQEYLNTCHRLNRDEENAQEHLQCINNSNGQISTICQGNNANLHGLVHCQDRNSIRIKSSPNRLSMHRKNTDTFNSVGLPVVNSQNPRRNDEYLNESIIGNSISQFRRTNNDILEEEVQLRRLAIEECVLGDDISSLAQYKRANIDEALTSDGNNMVNNLLQYRMNNIDESILSEAHLMGRDDEIDFVVSQLRRKAIEESLNANSDPNNMFANSSQRNFVRKSMMEEAGVMCNDKHSPRRKFDDSNSPLNQSNLRNLNNSDVSGDANNLSLTQLRRINIEDAILNSDQSITLTSPLRRKGINDSNSSNNNDLNKSASPMSRKGIIMNDSVLSSNDDQNLSISSLQRKCFEDSVLGNQIESGLQHTKANINAALADLNHLVISNNTDLSNLSHFNTEFDADLGVNTEAGNRRGIVNQIEPNLQHKGHFDPNTVGISSEGGNRRGIVDGVCLAPDLRYEPVRGFDKDTDEVDSCDVAMMEGDANRQGDGMHLRCCSDSNTMDSGWQSGSEKHVTD